MTSNQLSLMSLKTELSPEDFSKALINKGPVFWSEEEKIWVVTDGSFAETVLKRPEFSADRSSFFASRMQHIHPSVVGDFFGVVQKMMVTSDAPQHTARRRLGSYGISDHVLDEFKPNVEKTVDDLLLRLKDKDRFDFVNEIAQELPSIVLAELFSIEQDKRQDFYEWSNNMTQFFGAGQGCPMSHAVAANESAARLRDFFSALIAERRKNPKKDFLSILVQHQSGLGLDDSEVISQAIMMLVAGKVTTTDQISNNMNTFLVNREAIEAARTSSESLNAAIEEATRLDPAVNFVFRIVKEDTVLVERSVKAGDVVFVSIHAVNRDSRNFSDPHIFSLNRGRNPHFSYGHGAHYCLGARLARIQMNVLFRKLFDEFPRIDFDQSRPSVKKHQSLAFSGFESLPLRV